MHYDVFNGDADGILALLQLRLSEPKESKLITGVKRDINLLKQVDVTKATSVTVLDISMEKNAEALMPLLAKNIDVFYCDHHRPGDIPSNNSLEVLIDTDPNTCTSLLVNKKLNNKYVNWAIAAAYGDNMVKSADTLADENGLSQQQKQLLNNLGVYINYNGYGRSVEDLHFAPDELFKKLTQYADPLTLIAEENGLYQQLESAYNTDMALAERAEILADNVKCKVVVLPDEPWARRVSGVFGNALANMSPDKAHAVFTINVDGTYTVSLRAPLNNKQGAGDICASFDTGGGRAAAAGVNQLPKELVSEFIDRVTQYYS